MSTLQYCMNKHTYGESDYYKLKKQDQLLLNLASIISLLATSSDDTDFMKMTKVHHNVSCSRSATYPKGSILAESIWFSIFNATPTF